MARGSTGIDGRIGRAQRSRVRTRTPQVERLVRRSTWYVAMRRGALVGALAAVVGATLWRVARDLGFAEVGLGPTTALTAIIATAFVGAAVAAVVLRPRELATASLLDGAADRDHLLRAVFESAARIEQPSAVVENLWAEGERQATNTIPRSALGVAPVSLGAVASVALAVVLVIAPPTRVPVDDGLVTGPTPSVADAASSADAAEPPAEAPTVSARTVASVEAIRDVARAIADDARAAGDERLESIAHELATLADGFERGSLDATGLAAAVDGVVQQIDELLAASPVRRESYRGSLVDSTLTLTAEASGIGDHRIDDDRPEIASPVPERDPGEDEVAVHHSERSDFRRVGEVDDAGGGPGDPARNLGENGFVETNVNLERTTSVGFDPYDQDLDAVRSQLAAYEDLPREGMRAIDAGGGDGDAGMMATDLFGVRQTDFDLDRWQVFEREIVDLADGHGGRGRIELSAPQAMQGTSLARADDGGYSWERTDEIGTVRETVRASAVGLAARYFVDRRAVALAAAVRD